MTNHDTQKTYYLNSWRIFFFNILGWSETRVWEWIRKTGKDRLLTDYESWLYHDPPVVWAVEALVSSVLPKRLSSKAMTGLRNEILDVFADDDYCVSMGSNWPLHSDRINQILKKYGAQLPKLSVSPLFRQSFTEITMRHGSGSSYHSSGSNLHHERTTQNQFKIKKSEYRMPSVISLSKRKSSSLTIRELVRG